MKKIKVSLTVVTMIILSTFVSFALAEEPCKETKRFDLKPGESGYMKIDGPGIPGQFNDIVVTTTSGRVQISVTDSDGKKIVKGRKTVKFKMSKKETTYTIRFKNRTRKNQRVNASMTFSCRLKS